MRKTYIGVLVIFPDKQYFNDIWAFDLEKQQWTEWTDRIAKGPAPHARDHHSAVYLDGRMVIYGGRGGKDYESAEALGDMWELDVERLEWHELRGNGTAPVPRFLHSLADYQTQKGHTRLVVFGGEGPFGCYLNDVWEFNPRNVTWTPLSALDLTQAGCMEKLTGDDKDSNAAGRRMIDY